MIQSQGDCKCWFHPDHLRLLVVGSHCCYVNQIASRSAPSQLPM